jgi:hypothetical protein
VLLWVLFAPALVSSQGWITVSPPGGGFSIQVPSTPEALPVQTDTLNGKPLEIHMYRLNTGNLVYVFGWTEYNQTMNVERELDLDRDNFVKGVKGSLSAETRIEQNGVRGREFTGQTPTGFFVSRIYVHGSRAFQAAIVLRNGSDDTRAVTRFLHSLKLNVTKQTSYNRGVTWKYCLHHTWPDGPRGWAEAFVRPDDPSSAESLWVTIDCVGAVEEESQRSQRLHAWLGDRPYRVAEDGEAGDSDVIVNAAEFTQAEFLEWVKVWLRAKGFDVTDLVAAPLEEFAGTHSHADLLVQLTRRP